MPEVTTRWKYLGVSTVPGESAKKRTDLVEQVDDRSHILSAAGAVEAVFYAADAD